MPTKKRIFLKTRALKFARELTSWCSADFDGKNRYSLVDGKEHAVEFSELATGSQPIQPNRVLRLFRSPSKYQQGSCTEVKVPKTLRIR